MKGETVTINYQGDGGTVDPFGKKHNPVINVTVGNVLVQPGETVDQADSNRPDGVRVKYRLYFPKLFVYGIDPDVFRGATVTVRGKDYDVIGNPGYLDAENCPTEWCMTVNVKEIDG